MKPPVSILLAAVLALPAGLCWVPANPVSAAPGDPDTAFKSTGFTRAGIGPAVSNIGAGVVAQADGRIIVAGNAQNGDNMDFSLFRYNTDGSLDNTFGTNGRVLTTFGAAHEIGTCITIQGDDKIVAGGYSGGQFAVARYLPDGTLDASFSGDGRATAGEINMCSGNGITLQPDGKIVLVGSRVIGSANHLALVRFLPDGSLDATFGTNGIVTSAFLDSEIGEGVVLQEDLKIVAVARAFILPSTDVIEVVRYNPDGSLDPSFDFNGYAVTTIGASAEGLGITLQTSLTDPTKLVVVGTADMGFGGYDLAIVRYNPDGSLDTSFGGDGIVTTDLSGDDDGAESVLIQYTGATPTGIVVSGWATVSGYYDFAAARYSLNGLLDSSFDGDGVVITAVSPPFVSSPDDAASGMIRSFGQIVLVGSAQNLRADCAVVRYNHNGSLDTSFDGDGIRLEDAGNHQAIGRDVLIQPDGRIVIAGVQRSYADRDFAVFRCLPDGSPDSSFNSAGWTIFPVGFVQDEATTVSWQPDGKIVVAGYSESGADTNIALARLNSDGTGDVTFGSFGIVSTHVAGLNVTVEDMVIQPDGRIVVAGTAWSNQEQAMLMVVARFQSDGGPDVTFARALALQPDGKLLIAGSGRIIRQPAPSLDFVAVRLNADGSYDTSFGLGGIAIMQVAAGNNYGRSVAVQPDGRIIVAGHTEPGSNQDVALVRLNADGSLDTTFDGDGIVLTPIDSPSGTVDGLVLQSNGRIVVAGSSLTNLHDVDFLRYNADGSLDGTYGDAGFATFDIDSGTWDDASGLALDSDGHAVVAGTSSGLFLVGRVLGDGTVSAVSIEREVPGPMLQVQPPYPNPTRLGAVVEFRTVSDEPVTAVLIDASGRRIRTFGAGERHEAGFHQFVWDGRGDAGAPVASGVYFVRITHAGGSVVRSLTVLH
jgi:uncharacterized delta-60 repeat protein